MPNWVQTFLDVTGPEKEIERLLTTVKSDKSDEEFTFQKIIPMPESLNIISGTSTEIALLLAAEKKYGQDASTFPGWLLDALSHYFHYRCEPFDKTNLEEASMKFRNALVKAKARLSLWI